MIKLLLLSVIAISSISVGISQVHAVPAVIDQGTIQMGINDEGHLNAPYPDLNGNGFLFDDDPLGINFVGLRYIPTGAASTEPGCLCEGWGVSNGVVSGYANEATGTAGLVVNSFGSTPTTAISDVDAAGIFNVVHDYHPSASPNLYEVDVTITNISNDPQQLLYRRVMDWDIYPTPFSEFVTIIVNTSLIVFRTDTNGFNSANPLTFSSFQVGPSASNGFTPIIDSGPEDHGALFDFDFGILAPGESKKFTTFYGAAGNEADALAALTAVTAEDVYSFGQPNTQDGPNLGVPNTFIFGFKGVGGKPVGTTNIIVAGEILPIDSAALLIAGVQSNSYSILGVLAFVGAAAFGSLYLKSKRKI